MFISTESLNINGEHGERRVWEKIKQVFSGRKCIAYWRYPIFCQKEKTRKEPDILIADVQLGIIVIEVKSLTINQIVSIQGHRWYYKNFYTPSGSPYQQAETQLFSLLKYFNQEPSLYNKITTKVLIALPFITSQEWEIKNFHKLPNNPPILFKNNLISLDNIYQIIKTASTVTTGKKINNNQWNLLLNIISGTPILSKPSHPVLTKNDSQGKIIQNIRNHLYKFDLNQEKIAKQIPSGFQRIRGIAGSGKTVLLCQKAAIMHLKHPQ